jgi:hypothetical protein
MLLQTPLYSAHVHTCSVFPPLGAAGYRRHVHRRGRFGVEGLFRREDKETVLAVIAPGG